MSEKLLGVDYGDKKVGLAMADLETKIATPYKILTNDKNLFEVIKDICQNENISKIVIGVPTGLQGIKSKQYEKVINFISKLKSEIKLPLEQQDENLTSLYAKNLLQETKGRKEDDAVAAMIILQSYLDEMNGRGV
jgi:putative Holliday junction resolvase